MTSIVEMVRHYQRSIEKSLENPARLLHCVEKLNKLPITVEHLQETGVGKTVNNLRKYDGEVGYASKALVSKWKTMVAKEEAENDSPGEDETPQEQDECHAEDDDDHEDEQEAEDDDDEEENQLQIDETENIEPHAESSSEEVVEKNHHKKSSKHSSDKKHKHHTSSSSSSSKTDKKHKESSKSRHKDKESSRHESRKSEKSSKNATTSDTKLHKHHKESKETEKSSHHHHSSSKSDKKSSSEPNSNKEKSSRDTKKESKSHESDRKKSSKKDKDREDKDAKKRKRENNEFQIDSTMGASFADALGMLDMPSSSKTVKKIEKPSTSASQAIVPVISSSKKSSSHSSSSSSTTSNVVSTKKLMAEPEALSKRPRLEPLLDIVADIPAPTFTISNNYKPMPLNQTVMDCVFSQQSSKPMKQMTDEEALTYSIMSNKSRTKVFSGNKANARGKVDSLFDLCIRVLQDHIDYLEYTGGVPFDILRPVLERCTHEQLMTLEDYNPYLIEDSDILWEQHCKRRFRGKCPEEMESWREMFLRCTDEEQAKFKNLTANIKLARDKKLPVRKTKLAYVDTTVKAPRGIKSRQMKYGTDTLPNVTPAARVESLRNIGGNAASIGDRRLKIAAELRNSIPTHGPRINPNKKAPLMAKTLISMKKVFKR